LRDIVAVVQANQLGPGPDELVVGDWNVDDGGGDLSADLYGARVDERVVCRFVVSGIKPPRRGQAEQDDAPDNAQQRDGATATRTFSPPLFLARRRGTGRKIRAFGIGAALVVNA
jgi:hypothetical protein